MRIPFLTRLLEIKEEQLIIENKKLELLKDIKHNTRRQIIEIYKYQNLKKGVRFL